MTAGADDGAPVRLIESLRWDGRLHRVERHLGRLAGSARHFGYPFDEEEIRRRLAAAVEDLPEGPVRKVRLSLGPDGGVKVARTVVEPLPDPVPVLLSDVRLDTGDDLLRHKTDRRRTYDEARRRAADAGYREVLFLNTRGEVTEGSFTNVFVQVGAAWRTPPVACGLLPGVYRQVILDTREGVEEAVLRPEDVLSADAVWLCNSVRGLLPARVSRESPR